MQILLNGKFTDEERKEFADLFSAEKIKTGEYVTKGVDLEQVVRIIFHDFDAVVFVRDLILGKILESFADRVWRWAHTKRPTTKVQISFDLNFGEDKPHITLVMPSDIKDNESFIKATNIFITPDFVKGLKKGEVVSISWNKDKRILMITRF